MAKCLPGLGWCSVSPTKQPATLSVSLWLQHAVAAILFSGKGSMSTTESFLRKLLQHFPLPGRGTTMSLWLWAAPGLQKTGMVDQWVLLPPRTSPVLLPPIGALGRRDREGGSLPCWRDLFAAGARGYLWWDGSSPRPSKFMRSEAGRLPWGQQMG